MDSQTVVGSRHRVTRAVDLASFHILMKVAYSKKLPVFVLGALSSIVVTALALGNMGGIMTLRRQVATSDVVLLGRVLAQPEKRRLIYVRYAATGDDGPQRHCLRYDVLQNTNRVYEYMQAMMKVWEEMGEKGNEYGLMAAANEIARHQQEWTFRCSVQQVLKGEVSTSELSIVYSLAPQENKRQVVAPGNDYVFFLWRDGDDLRPISTTYGVVRVTNSYAIALEERFGLTNLTHSAFINELRTIAAGEYAGTRPDWPKKQKPSPVTGSPQAVYR